MMRFNRLGRKINASTKRGGLWCKFVIKMLPHFTEETFISNGQNVLQDRSQECNWRCKNDTTSVGPLSLGLPMVQQRQLAKQSVRNATVGQSNCYPDLTKPTLSNPIALQGAQWTKCLTGLLSILSFAGQLLFGEMPLGQMTCSRKNRKWRLQFTRERTLTIRYLRWCGRRVTVNFVVLLKVQCDQMARTFSQYLAIYENMPNSLKSCKTVSKFGTRRNHSSKIVGNV